MSERIPVPKWVLPFNILRQALVCRHFLVGLELRDLRPPPEEAAKDNGFNTHLKKAEKVVKKETLTIKNVKDDSVIKWKITNPDVAKVTSKMR